MLILSTILGEWKKGRDLRNYVLQISDDIFESYCKIMNKNTTNITLPRLDQTMS